MNGGKTYQDKKDSRNSLYKGLWKRLRQDDLAADSQDDLIEVENLDPNSGVNWDEFMSPIVIPDKEGGESTDLNSKAFHNEEDIEDPELDLMLESYLEKHGIKDFYFDDSTGLVAIQAYYDNAFGFARELYDRGVIDERKWIWKGKYGSISQVHGIELAKRELKIVIANEDDQLVYDYTLNINDLYIRLGELPKGKYNIYIKRAHRDNSKMNQNFEVTKAGITFLDITLGKNGFFTYTTKTEPPVNSLALMALGDFGTESIEELNRLYRYYTRNISELAGPVKGDYYLPSTGYGTSDWGMYDERATKDSDQEIKNRENATGLLAISWSPGAGSEPFKADFMTMLEKQLKPYEISAAIQLVNDLGIEKNFALKDNIYSSLLQKRIADKQKSFDNAFKKEIHKEAPTIEKSIGGLEAFAQKDRMDKIHSIVPDFNEVEGKTTAHYYKNEFSRLELYIPDNYREEFSDEESLKMLIKRWHEVNVFMATAYKKVDGKEGYFFTKEQKDIIADFCLHLYFNLPNSNQSQYGRGDDEIHVDNEYTSSTPFFALQTMLWSKDKKKVESTFKELENSFFQVIDRYENNPYVFDPIDQVQDQIVKEKGILKNYSNVKKLPGILMPAENLNEALRKVAPELGEDVDIDTLSLPLYYKYEDGEYTIYLAHKGYISSAYTYRGDTMDEALTELSTSGDLPEGKMHIKYKKLVYGKNVERELSLADWLGIASVVLFGLALTAVTAGAGAAVYVPYLTGAGLLLGAASSMANLVRNYEQNKLDTKNVLLDVTTIVACIIPAVGTLARISSLAKFSNTLEKVSRFSKISGTTKSVIQAIQGTKYYRLTVYSSAATTMIDGAVLTAEVIEGIVKIEGSGLTDDQKNEKLRQFFQHMIISSFFFVISAKADMGDLKSFKNFKTIEKFEAEVGSIKTKSDYQKVIKSIEVSDELDNQAKQIVKQFAEEKYFRVKSGIETGANPERVSQIKSRDAINEDATIVSTDIVEIESKLENSPNQFVFIDPFLSPVLYYNFQKYVRKKLNNNLNEKISTITTKEGLIEYLQTNQTYYRFNPEDKTVQRDLEIILRESNMLGVTDDIQKKVRLYRELKPNTSFTNKELVEKFESGYEISKYNSLFRPDKKIHHEVKTSIDPEFEGTTVLGNKAISNEYSEEVKALAEVRSELYDKGLTLSMKKKLIENKKGPIKKGDDLYEEIKANKLAKIRNSEVLAETSSDAYFVSKDYTRIFPPDGSISSISGEFDRIYLGPGGEIVIVEAKGGLSKLGSREIRNIPDEDLLGKRAEQGSTEYLIEIIYTMEKNGANPKLIKDIKLALEDESLKYLKAQQSFDVNGGLKPLKIHNFIIDQDIVEKLIKIN